MFKHIIGKPLSSLKQVKSAYGTNFNIHSLLGTATNATPVNVDVDGVANNRLFFAHNSSIYIEIKWHITTNTNTGGVRGGIRNGSIWISSNGVPVVTWTSEWSISPTSCTFSTVLDPVTGLYYLEVTMVPFSGERSFLSATVQVHESVRY